MAQPTSPPSAPTPRQPPSAALSTRRSSTHVSGASRVHCGRAFPRSAPTLHEPVAFETSGLASGWHDGSVTEHVFYSDRVGGPQPAVNDSLPVATARGLLSLIQTKIGANWLAGDFPERCPDGAGVSDTDVLALAANLQALVPDAPWPLTQVDAGVSDEVIFDLVEYAATRVAEPVHLQYHSYFGHYELRFKLEEGREKFRAEVNAILRRGRAMYELHENGEVHRLGTPDVRAVIARLDPATGNDRLDELLVEARKLYASHRAGDRAVALERLWDAFERLKTVDLPGGDKKRSVQILLDHFEPDWRPIIEVEMTALTNLGNEYEIRHLETRAKALPESAGDYLFARMGALITELLKTSGRLRTLTPELKQPWE
jgi:hypothetical protein